MQYRTVRVRPLRAKRIAEFGFELPDGIDPKELVEVWVGGNLDAVCRPGAATLKERVVWAIGTTSSTQLDELLNAYVPIVGSFHAGGA